MRKSGSGPQLVSYLPSKTPPTLRTTKVQQNTRFVKISIRMPFIWNYIDDIRVIHQRHRTKDKFTQNHPVRIFKANFSVPILLKLVKACDSFPSVFIYKSIFLLAHVIVKWENQCSPLLHTRFSKFPPSPPLLFALSLPSKSSFPLPLGFLPPPFASPSSFSPMSAPMISAILSKIFAALNLDPSHFGFHAFRRPAVSWAANHDVPLQNLKAHGGWSFNTIHAYLKFTPKAFSTVATTFQQHLTI